MTWASERVLPGENRTPNQCLQEERKGSAREHGASGVGRLSRAVSRNQNPQVPVERAALGLSPPSRGSTGLSPSGEKHSVVLWFPWGNVWEAVEKGGQAATAEEKECIFAQGEGGRGTGSGVSWRDRR